MDRHAVIIGDLRVGAIGSDASRLLGALLLSSLQIASMQRAPGARPFIAYVDEFQRFASNGVAVTLSESRKYGLGLVLAHQYVEQLPPDVRDAVAGNVGSVIAFRLGAGDAPFLAEVLGPPVEPADLQMLPRFRFAARLVVRGEELPAFFARSVLPTPNDGRFASPQAVRAASRTRFS